MEKLDSVLEVYVDGELVGYADCVISDNHGSFYGDLSTGDKLQDNGECVLVNGYGVEVK